MHRISFLTFMFLFGIICINGTYTAYASDAMIGKVKTLQDKIDSVGSNARLVKDFGGKVTLSPIPGLDCLGTGKIAVLSSNISAIKKVVDSISDPSTTEEKALNIASSIHGMIPTYTTNPSKNPRTSGQILGKENIVPDFKTCGIQVGTVRVPIPVLRTTKNYNTSKTMQLRLK